MKPPRRYLSHSQFALFNVDPEKYFQDYYVSKIDILDDDEVLESTKQKINLGKIFQLAWCDPEYNYAAALIKAGYTPDFTRAIRTALEHRQTMHVPKSRTEVIMRAKGLGLDCTILSKMDGMQQTSHTRRGRTTKDVLIVENKYGKTLSADQVKMNDQFTWYMLTVYIKLGVMPRMLVQSFNSCTGIPTIYDVRRNKADFKSLIERINSTWARIVKNDYTKYI
jgi:hypothetical protein